MLVGLMALVLFTGCSADKAPRFGIGDKVILTNDKDKEKAEHLGLITGTIFSSTGHCWWYNVKTRGGMIEVWDKPEYLQLYQAMDWNELDNCPRVRVEGVPKIPTLAPQKAEKQDKTTDDFPAFKPTLQQALEGKEWGLA